MSDFCGTSLLYIACNSAEQRQAVIDWLREYDKSDYFKPTEGINNKLWFDFNEEVLLPHGMDKVIKEIATQLKLVFGVDLRGHWVEEVDGIKFVCQYKNGEVLDTATDWVFDYNTEQLLTLRAIARERLTSIYEESGE